jgi:hypothetical protein
MAGSGSGADLLVEVEDLTSAAAGLLGDPGEAEEAGLPTHLYVIVLGSACLHASWNFVIRSTKGNNGVVLSAYLILVPIL